jgi:hypothetical protein
VQNLHIDTLKIAISFPISYLKSCSMSAIGRNSFPLRPPHRRQTLQRIQACVRRNHAPHRVAFGLSPDTDAEAYGGDRTVETSGRLAVQRCRAVGDKILYGNQVKAMSACKCFEFRKARHGAIIVCNFADYA